MVKAQPLKCTNTFQRGKSETEESAALVAPLQPHCALILGGQHRLCVQVCSVSCFTGCLQRCMGADTLDHSSASKGVVQVWKNPKSRVVMKE